MAGVWAAGPDGAVLRASQNTPSSCKHPGKGKGKIKTAKMGEKPRQRQTGTNLMEKHEVGQ